VGDCQNLGVPVQDPNMKRTPGTQFNELGPVFTQDGFDAMHIAFRDRFNQSSAELIQNAFHFFLEAVVGDQQRGLTGEQQQDRTYQQQPAGTGPGNPWVKI
jgi:hypothetical protein